MADKIFTGSMFEKIIPALVTTVLGGMMAKKEPKESKPKKLPLAPSVNDQARRAKKEREIQRKYAYSGRAGTVLDSSTLG